MNNSTHTCTYIYQNTNRVSRFSSDPLWQVNRRIPYELARVINATGWKKSLGEFHWKMTIGNTLARTTLNYYNFSYLGEFVLHVSSVLFDRHSVARVVRWISTAKRINRNCKMRHSFHITCHACVWCPACEWSSHLRLASLVDICSLFQKAINERGKATRALPMHLRIVWLIRSYWFSIHHSISRL